MTAIAQEYWQEQEDEPQVCIDGRIDPEAEDAYWQRVYFGEPYYRRECSWEDYAPAYCVGYIGFAQYGGRFEDAEKSLCANWLRIKGDSCLQLEEAMQAIQAAWDHASQRQQEENDEVLERQYAPASAPAREPACAVA